MRRLYSVDIRTEQSILAAGLFTDPNVWGDAKAFMAYVGRYLGRSAYRAVGLPDQKVIAEDHFGWGVRRLKSVIRHLKDQGYLATKRDGFAGGPTEFAYLLRSPQMGLNLAPQVQTGALVKVQTGALTTTDPRGMSSKRGSGSNPTPVRTSKTNTNHARADDAGPRAGEVLVVLERRGVRTDQRAEIVACRTPEEITDWVSAVPFRIAETGGQVVKSEAAILYWALRQSNGPAPRPLPAAFVARRQVEPLAAAIAAKDLEKRRAANEDTATSELTPEQQRELVAKAKRRAFGGA